MIMEKDVPVRMKDGATLYLNVFRPEKEGKFPVVISADVYGKDRPATDTYSIRTYLGSISHSMFTAFESPDPAFWVPEDYVVIKVALRGSQNSEGNLLPMSSSVEAQDYYELIEWAGVQKWSNGNVGMNGVSYLAMTQWMVAALNPPHLKAMIPWEGLSDMYREMAFHSGIPCTKFFRDWSNRQYHRWGEERVEDMVVRQSEHPLFDEYWEDRASKLGDIEVPMYVVASWSTQGLHNRGTLEGFKQSASKHKWLEIHGRKEWEYYYSRQSLERQKRFFDHFLKEIDSDWMDTPKVRLEVRDKFYEGEVRSESEWPIKRTNYTKLYLDGNCFALTEAPIKDEALLSYCIEPQNNESGNLIFNIKFDKDTELTGYTKLRLWVSADGSDDMDLFVALKKIDRRGMEVHFPDYNHIEDGQVAPGWLRVSHRELDPDKSTPYQPWLKHQSLQKLKPGEIVPVDIEILSSSTLFHAGESLRLVISGSEIIYRSTGCRHEETVNRGKHLVYVGGQYDSHLLVPIIP